MGDGRLLILDDDPMTGQTIQSIAEFAGLEVRCTTCATVFFDHVDQWRPEVIALDLVMPAMDGVQVVAELARRRCTAQIIITSGVGSRILDAAARSAAEHGLEIAGVLPKPFLPAALRELLTRSLASRAPAYPPAGATPGGPRTSPVPGEPSEDELRQALGRRQLFVVYQPKLHCQSGALAGFEALVRWNHPAFGLVPPDRFIPLAEHTGLIDAVTREVFTMALGWFAELRTSTDPGGRRALSAQTLANLTLSVNVSARSLGNVELFDWLETCCIDLALPPRNLILELTETSAMEDPGASLDTMTRLRMKGFQLSIDDFGTGYSSMLQLVRLPFSEIKVDKSFVMTAGRSEESRSVIQSVVNLGRSLGLKSTAEGVEDEATLVYLRRIGCDLAQGYHIARPMAGDQVVPWAHKHDATRESLRLEGLRSLQILDTPQEVRFDRITRLAQRIFRVPIALISLVDANRQWFKSHPGLGIRETPREWSFCAHAIQNDATLLIGDASTDRRFRDNPLVTAAPSIRFYAGCPLRIPDGSTVGTLCLIDTVPRAFSAEDETLLRDLAQRVEKELAEPRNAITDPATGLLNRHGFESRARDDLALSVRLNHPTTLLFMKLRETMADRPGPEARERALAEFAAMMRATFRESDLLAHLSDGDFVVLMTDASIDDADETGHRLRQAIAAHNAQPRTGPRLDSAIGIAGSFPDNHRDLQALLAEADARMNASPRSSTTLPAR